MDGKEERVTVEGSARSQKAVKALLSDLYPPSQTSDARPDALEEVVCAAAAARRLSLLGCFKNATVIPAFLQNNGTTKTAKVVVDEPKLRWALGIHTTAGAGRRVGAAVTASLRNVLGSLASLDARVGLGSTSDAEVGGELTLSRMLFPDGGRAAIARSQAATEEVEAAADAATGTPTLATLGVRAATEDRTALADAKRRVVAVFASLRAPGPAGTLSVELARESVSTGPGAAPALAQAAARGSLAFPRLRLSHVLGFDRLLGTDVGEKGRKAGVAACLASEVGLGGEAEYMRETAAAEARAALGGGVVVSLVARVGALLGLRTAEATPVAAGLEGFSIGSTLVRCMRARMPHAEAGHKTPVAAFASLAATLAMPIPFVPPVVASSGRRAGMHLFVDAGGITHTASPHAVLDAAVHRPRVTAGAGFSLPLGGSGRIELNFALPIARHPQDTFNTFDFNTTPSYLF